MLIIATQLFLLLYFVILIILSNFVKETTLFMRKSNYDKQPSTHIDGKVICGWDKIVQTLAEAWADEPVWVIDLYCGTYEEDFISAFAKSGRKIIDTLSLMRPEEDIRQLTERFMTDDVLFGYMSNIRLHEYFDFDGHCATDRQNILHQPVPPFFILLFR